MRTATYSVVDLFSGAGGMSLGFHKHPSFQIIAAADAELGKPSSGKGKLQCNSSYKENIGISPSAIDLSEVIPKQIRQALGLDLDTRISVLSACPPCTGSAEPIQITIFVMITEIALFASLQCSRLNLPQMLLSWRTHAN